MRFQTSRLNHIYVSVLLLILRLICVDHLLRVSVSLVFRNLSVVVPYNVQSFYKFSPSFPRGIFLVNVPIYALSFLYLLWCCWSLWVRSLFMFFFFTASVVCCNCSLFRVLKHVFLKRFVSKTSLATCNFFYLSGSCYLFLNKCTYCMVQGFLPVCYFYLLVRYSFLYAVQHIMITFRLRCLVFLS